jgi:hypothetical protein
MPSTHAKERRVKGQVIRRPHNAQNWSANARVFLSGFTFWVTEFDRIRFKKKSHLNAHGFAEKTTE